MRGKFQVIIGGVDNQWKKKIVDNIGFTEGLLSFRSLGIPITASRLSVLDCNVLVEKITAKISQ